MFDEKNNNLIPNEQNDENVEKVQIETVASDTNEASESLSATEAVSQEQSEDVSVSEECATTEEVPKEVCDTCEDVSEAVTEPTPVLPSQDNTTSFYGGVSYTNNADGENKSGYGWNTEVSEKTTKEKNKSGKGFKIFIGAVMSVFTISVVTLTVMVASHLISGNVADIKSDSQNKQNQATTSVNTSPSVSASTSNFVAFDREEFEGETLTIPQIAAKCSPSSVGIVSQVEVSYSYPFGFGSATGVSEASGSGFIYSADGYVITNHHVIENAKKVTVILHDGKEVEAEIVGSDSLSDIAVLKLKSEEELNLIPMEIGNSDELVVGEAVVAIGCPAGIEFIGTVTDGIVSAINRNVEIRDNYGSNRKTMTLIQTNATINHGNSGGPLINSRGQAVGINTLKLNSSSYEGIGFSIPMNGAMPIIKQLIEHGKVVERTQDDFAYGKGIIGISGSAISEDEAEYYNIPVGVLVVQIDKNSSASKAGLRRGDIITHYNGTEVKTVEEINTAKGNGRAGEEVTVTVYRDSESGEGEGQTLDITFNLDSQN